MGRHSKKINALKERYDQARARRWAQQDRERPYMERMSAIYDANRYVLTDFYCTVCKKDCAGTAVKQVCNIRPRLPTAWYLGICPKGHRMIRRITDKDSDPYYDLSPFVARQRYELRDALLTPFDPRFKELYPEQYAKLFPNSLESGAEQNKQK